MSNCGKCHRCGTPLQRVLDGEEWCPKCQQYRRYRSHGWVYGESSCCAPELEQKLQADLLDEYTLEEYEDWLVDGEDDEGSDWPDPVY